ncbi:single-stranded-DNA-specific exonuclease RecJ [Azospirillum sp. RWY-5-1]|uniref:Single-stranded-DNA-specific exonuclease RecJ n=1 Tax=Azospirillum oleiclasticum TaxID=2735135 RepID=A0ABX2T928_9PROT|nr:single-stranded-DNA-specific exonuclease RecJ [Azospirillum oleiclasticum]NYZ12284.1 single-stranded-DNA-specific exonuclease RecJ [Azospirillum oleiclasticum]NYZ19444.1 single-stranded-DNA-specific exonuclease RecJ [Azospirillum oleiclasticum]
MTDAPRPFLNVARSVTGKRWQARPFDERLAWGLAQGRGLPEIVGRVLASRGVGEDGCDVFLNPTLRSCLPDPSRFVDMDKAASRIAAAIMDGEPVAVFGDYDVDGATSAALWRRFFRALGTDLRVYVPDRVKEGYGPNAQALVRLRNEGVRLVVTVDCGVSAFAALEAAAEAGLEVVVLDHHAAEPRLPPAVAVVNPNRLDEDGAFRTLCAAGVCFLTVVAVNRELRRAGFYADRPEPPLMDWLDLVALGTVCDVVPLVGLNRALVAQGLKVMARRSNPGLAALADVAGVKDRPDAYHAGYILGPRVNAGGRVGEADMGARLLSTDDPVEAMDLARRLDAHNGERRQIEQVVLDDAMALVERHAEEDTGLVFVSGEGWHPGVIGIVASRLKERFGRPACVVALVPGDGGMMVGKASGRSVRGVDLGAAVIAARQEGLLLAGGGHRMAAGFTVRGDRLDDLRRFLGERVAEQVGSAPLVPTLDLDGALAVGGATATLVETLAKLGPFGTGNAEPRFALADARVVRADVVGANHVRVILAGNDGARLKGIAFRALDGALGQALLRSGSATLHLAGVLRVDRWNGNEAVQLLIDDVAHPHGG